MLLSLFFTIIIHLVVLPALVLALFHVVAVAVDDDLDFAVEADDALVGALLSAEGVVGDVEAVVDHHVVLLLEAPFVLAEALDDFGLFDDLVGELLHLEGVVLFEELQRAVQQVDLVGLGDLELLGQRLGDEILGQGHRVLRVRVAVLALAYVEEVVHPVLRLDAAVGVIDHGHHVAVLALLVEDEAALVELLDVDALLAFEVEVAALVQHPQERVLVLRLEQPDGVHGVAIHDAVAEIDRVELAALDFWVGALLVEVFGEVHRLLVERFRTVKDLGNSTINHVVLDAAVVVEFEEFFGGEGGEEIAY